MAICIIVSAWYEIFWYFSISVLHIKDGEVLILCWCTKLTYLAGPRGCLLLAHWISICLLLGGPGFDSWHGNAAVEWAPQSSQSRTNSSLWWKIIFKTLSNFILWKYYTQRGAITHVRLRELLTRWSINSGLLYCCIMYHKVYKWCAEL